MLEIRSRDPGTCALCAAVEKTRRALPAHPLLAQTGAGRARAMTSDAMTTRNKEQLRSQASGGSVPRDVANVLNDSERLKGEGIE